MGNVILGLGQGTELEAKAVPQGKLLVLSSMKRWQNQTSNELRGGGGGPEARLTEQGDREGKLLICDSERGQSLAAGDVFSKNVLTPANLSTFIKAGDGGQVSYLSCPVWRQHQPSIREPLPPEPLYHMRDKQEEPREETSSSVSEETAALAAKYCQHPHVYKHVSYPGGSALPALPRYCLLVLQGTDLPEKTTTGAVLHVQCQPGTVVPARDVLTSLHGSTPFQPVILAKGSHLPGSRAQAQEESLVTKRSEHNRPH